MAAPVPTVELWVRAGSGEVRLGGCPECQQIFMALLLKSGLGGLNFDVKLASVGKPSEEQLQLRLHNLPTLVHDGQLFDVPDHILAYVEELCPEPTLRADGEEAVLKTVRELFSRFCFLIKGVAKDAGQLQAQLWKLDDYLKQNQPRTYLCGDRMCQLDCSVLPKLHHIRLAAEYFKDYKIPDSMVHVWRYLDAGYHSDAFAKSCPCDQEILLHWANRPGMRSLTAPEMSRLNKSPAVYSLKIPDSVLRG